MAFAATAAIVTLLAGIVIGRYLLPRHGPGKPAPLCPSCVTRYRVEPSPSAPILGPQDAPVTAVLISDPARPESSRLTRNLEALQRQHPDNLRIALVLDPRLPGNEIVAKAVQAANAQGKAWPFYRALLERKGQPREKELDRIAEDAGLDVARFRHDLHAKAVAHLVTTDGKTLARLGVGPAPVLFFNGRLVPTDSSMAGLQRILEEETATMHKLLAELSRDHPKATSGQLVTMARKRLATSSLPSLGQGKIHPPAQAQEDPNAVYRVPVAGKPMKGPADALVTVVLFSNFQTPFGKTADAAVTKLLARHPQDVRVFWYDNPLPGQIQANLAAQACREVYEQKGAEAFWRYKAALMKSRRDLIRGQTKARLEQEAAKLGLDMDRFRNALASRRHASFIDSERNLAMDLGALGMVTFFVNGRKLRGPPSYKALDKLVTQELHRARKIVSGGKVSRSDYYASIISKGHRAVQFLSHRRQATVRRRVLAGDVVFRMPARGKPWKGAKSAMVTLVVSSDFLCPFSRRMATVLDALLSAYPDKIRIVWHNNPLPMHRYAEIAAEAAWEVFRQKGNPAFWKYHDLLFANQRRLLQDGPVYLEEAAAQVAVNIPKFRRALERRTHRRDMERQRRLAVRLGAVSTPTLFINGRALVGARPLTELKRRIDEEVDRVQKVLPKAGGLNHLYDYLMRNAATHAVYKEMNVPSHPRRPPMRQTTAPHPTRPTPRAHRPIPSR